MMGSIRKLFARLGVNYVWGLINFTLGVTLGGIWVAASLIAAGVVS